LENVVVTRPLLPQLLLQNIVLKENPAVLGTNSPKTAKKKEKTITFGFCIYFDLMSDWKV
jgi:hypothetical protein